MNRFGAFLIHLGISLVIFAGLASLVVFVWYPDFFFASDGGWQGIRIIAAVDLVLGPVLTLVVFNRAKPRAELRRDLTMIGTFQFVCLVAGTYVVYSERPLALVYADGSFFSMSEDDYLEASVPVPDLSTFPGPSPKRVIVEIPQDPVAQSEVRLEALRKNQPIRTLTSRYVTFDFRQLNPDDKALAADWVANREREIGDISQWTERHGGNIDEYAFFPFGARYGYLVLGVSRKSGDIVGLLDVPLHSRHIEG